MKINTMKTKVTHLKTTKLRKFEELHEKKQGISAWLLVLVASLVVEHGL